VLLAKPGLIDVVLPPTIRLIPITPEEVVPPPPIDEPIDEPRTPMVTPLPPIPRNDALPPPPPTPIDILDPIPAPPPPAPPPPLPDPPAPRAPVIVTARLTSPPSALQPAYPAAMRRAGTEGSVTVRVRIGTDGRVREVQLVSATHDQFFEATRRQALRGWRFRPATRDGVAIESWQQQTVVFRMANA